jgi:hypothetical protein
MTGWYEHEKPKPVLHSAFQWGPVKARTEDASKAMDASSLSRHSPVELGLPAK